MAVKQQMVWRVHKELSRRKRTHPENKNYGSHSSLDNDNYFIIFHNRTYPTSTTCSANTGNNGNCCYCGKYLHHKTAHLEKDFSKQMKVFNLKSEEDWFLIFIYLEMNMKHNLSNGTDLTNFFLLYLDLEKS